MISEREIWLAARAMMLRYGSNAGIEAAERADVLLEKGDMEGASRGSASWPRSSGCGL